MEGCILVIASEVKNYRAGSIRVTWHKDAPDQLQILLDTDQPTGYPIPEQPIQLYTRDAELLYRGTVDEVGREGIYRGSVHLSLPIRATGINMRLYDRITRDRLTGELAVFRSVDATVTCSGSTVTRTDGDHFDTTLAGKTVKINGSDFVVSSVTDPDHLEVSGGPGSGTFEYAVYSGDIVRELVDDAGKYMTADNITFTDESIEQGVKVKELFYDPCVAISDVMEDLLALNPTFGAWLEYNDSGNIYHFQTKSTTLAPVEFTDTSGKYRQDLSISVSREDTRNVEISVMDVQVLVTTKKQLTMDGTTMAWFLDRPVGQMVRMYFGTPDAPLPVTPGEQDTESQFMYHKGTRAVWQNPLDPPHAAADGPLTVEYYPLGDNLQEALDSADITRRSIIGAFSGRRELVVDRSKSPGQVETFNEAMGDIARFKDDLQKGKITTWEKGLRPGQVVMVQSAKMGIGDPDDVDDPTAPSPYYIETVTATDKDYESTEHDLLYELDVISAVRYSSKIETVNPARRISAAEVFRSFRGRRRLNIGGGGGGAVTSGALGHFDRTLLVKDSSPLVDATDHVTIYGGSPGEVSRIFRITGVLRKTITVDLSVKFHLKYTGESRVIGTFVIPAATLVDVPVTWMSFENDYAPDNSVVYGDVVTGDSQIALNGVASYCIEWGSKTLPEGSTGAQGLPTGGSDGEVLTKLSGTDYDVGWEAIPAPDLKVTTKGDLLGYTTEPHRIPVGTEGQILRVRAAGSPGLAWEDIPSSSVPLTTKGDLVVYDSGVNRLAVGTNGKVLTADSTAAAGVSWKDVPDQVPLTTKGDVLTFSTVDARLAVGSNGQVLTADSSQTTGLKWASPPYDIPFFMMGKPPSSVKILKIKLPRAVEFAANFSGSVGAAPEVNATATTTFSVQKNGSEIGTIAVGTGGAYTFATSGGTAVSFALGDILSVVSPSQDATLEGVAWVLVGSR